ncbi:hypothetical protein JQ543_32595 [Bradyrhizobium diazoefficiens]|nr:hypothetical protein [Bradyrhizobium diazoefficiens]MBR0852508.1 hypothetical protein [Bradyrhizobium diazoefficiens]
MILIAAGDQDNLLTAIIKWIPIDVIGFYKFAMGIVPLEAASWRLWISILAIPVTSLWIAFATTPEGRQIAWRQVLLAPFAFLCWAAAIQPDVMIQWQQWTGSIALAGGVLLLPILDGILRRLGVTQN